MCFCRVLDLQEVYESIVPQKTNLRSCIFLFVVTFLSGDGVDLFRKHYAYREHVFENMIFENLIHVIENPVFENVVSTV